MYGDEHFRGMDRFVELHPRKLVVESIGTHLCPGLNSKAASADAKRKLIRCCSAASTQRIMLQHGKQLRHDNNSSGSSSDLVPGRGTLSAARNVKTADSFGVSE